LYTLALTKKLQSNTFIFLIFGEQSHQLYPQMIKLQSFSCSMHIMASEECFPSALLFKVHPLFFSVPKTVSWAVWSHSD